MDDPASNLFKFTAEQNFLKFAGEVGQCFFVPAYQRYYVWKKADVDRFFIDLVNGMRALNSGKQEVTFIGTVTCFLDYDLETLESQNFDDMPASVISIVDGQQRLTTMMATALLLHNYIRENKISCSSELLGGDSVVDKHLSDLASTFETDRKKGNSAIYPKMIRAFDDKWSVEKDNLRYSSPLSNLIFQYSNHIRTSQKPFSVEAVSYSLPNDLSEEQITAHKNFLDLIKKMDKHIHSICDIGGFDSQTETSDERTTLPTVEEFTENEMLLSSICDTEKILEDRDVLKRDRNAHKLLRAFFLASYLLNRVHFVALIAPNENQVYDIFDSLNTTGQLLTAIETFKPEVILFEGSRNYLNSPSQKDLAKVENYVATMENADATKKLSSEIVIDFAYAENGRKLGGHLGEQRAFLKNQFALQKESKRKGREFVAYLSCVSQVIQNFWDKSGKDMLNIPSADSSCVQLCLKYLKDARHTICRPLISYFYYQLSEASEKKLATKELAEVIKAAAAFFAIWRSTRETTQRIDDWYRDLYTNDHPLFEKINSAFVFPPVNRQARETEGIVTASQVKQAFREILERNNIGRKVKIESCDDYVEKACRIPIYQTQKATARFLLLVSSHDAVPLGGAEHGELTDGRVGTNPMLLVENWDSYIFKTLEHILAQSSIDNTDDEADKPASYSADVLDRIGNLTLLPRGINSSLGNKPPEYKSIIYQAISADTIDKAEIILNEIKPPLKKGLLNKILKLHANRLLASLIFTEFTAAAINQRGKNIAERAWRILYDKWLHDIE